jgi:hypothetical protein
MKRFITLAMVGTLLTVSACTDPDEYPISGQECGPNDPVLDLDANNCVMPGF